MTDNRSRNRALVSSIVLPVLFLTVALLGGLRVNTQDHAFIFIAPHFVNFKDKPPVRERHPNDIVVSADGKTYQVDAAAVDAQDEGMVRTNFQRLLRPIAGAVTVDRVEQVRDSSGHVVAYRAWVRRSGT